MQIIAVYFVSHLGKIRRSDPRLKNKHRYRYIISFIHLLTNPIYGIITIYSSTQYNILQLIFYQDTRQQLNPPLRSVVRFKFVDLVQ